MPLVDSGFLPELGSRQIIVNNFSHRYNLLLGLVAGRQKLRRETNVKLWTGTINT